jgi:FtsZ-binding cell division protein ZapB
LWWWWSCRAQDLLQSQANELDEIRGTFQEVVQANAALKQEIESLKEQVHHYWDHCRYYNLMKRCLLLY